MGKIVLGFPNASCAHCARLVTQSLHKLDGVSRVEVDQIRQEVSIEFDPARVSVEAIRSLLDRAGYSTRVLKPTLRAA